MTKRKKLSRKKLLGFLLKKVDIKLLVVLGAFLFYMGTGDFDSEDIVWAIILSIILTALYLNAGRISAKLGLNKRFGNNTNQEPSPENQEPVPNVENTQD